MKLRGGSTTVHLTESFLTVTDLSAKTLDSSGIRAPIHVADAQTSSLSVAHRYCAVV